MHHPYLTAPATAGAVFAVTVDVSSTFRLPCRSFAARQVRAEQAAQRLKDVKESPRA
jgi:hypothetical protein